LRALTRTSSRRKGWAGGLPDGVLARIFAAAEARATVLGSRPRVAAGERATEQAYDLGAAVCAAGTLRRVCRAWRRVHDGRVTALRPRALHAEALPAAFPALARLDLSRVPFPPLPALAAALPRLRALTALTMRDNGTGHLAAATLASALRSPLCRLESLNLSENYVDDRGAASLAGALRASRTLAELNLRDNGVTDVGAAALAQALPGSRLAALDLSSNAGIGVDACVAFAHALAASPHHHAGAPPPRLRALSLGGCGVGDAGARVLGDALPACTSLALLSLFSAGIGDAGAAALAAGLARNASLTSLCLFGNAVRDAGAAALATALRANATCTSLDLFDNDIHLSGVAALVDVIAPGGGAAPALREVRLELAPPRVQAEAAVALVARAGARLVTAGVRGRNRGANGAGAGGAAAGAWRPHVAGFLAEDGALAAH
jgi:hypothetical protein